MSVEIEAKVAVHSHEAIAEKLRSLAAVLLADIEQADVYLDYPDKSLTAAGKGFRIRKQTAAGVDRVVLTYKGKRQDSIYKVRPEYEVEVSEYESAKEIVLGLGLEMMLTVEKRRVMWQLNECEVCLDNVSMLGLFVEVEGPSEAKVNRTLKMLGLEKLEHIQEGYAKMLHNKLAEEGLSREV